MAKLTASQSVARKAARLNVRPATLAKLKAACDALRAQRGEHVETVEEALARFEAHDKASREAYAAKYYTDN